MKKLIYTNENRLKLQIGYNEDWTKAVNLAIKELKEVCERTYRRTNYKVPFKPFCLV